MGAPGCSMTSQKCFMTPLESFMAARACFIPPWDVLYFGGVFYGCARVFYTFADVLYFSLGCFMDAPGC